MRKFLLTLPLLIIAVIAYGQKPTAGSKGFTFGLSNIFQNGNSSITNNGPARTGTLLFRYYLADGLAGRMSLSYSKTGTKVTDTSSVNGTEEVLKESGSRFAIQLGIQKSLGSAEKIEPYIGADLLFARTGGKYSLMTEVVNASGGGQPGNSVLIERNGNRIFNSNGNFTGQYQTPAIQIGIIPALGFNYFFSENFALGAEFGWGVIISRSNKSLETKTTQKVLGVETSTTIHTQDRVNNTTFGSTGNGMLTVSIFF